MSLWSWLFGDGEEDAEESQSRFEAYRLGLSSSVYDGEDVDFGALNRAAGLGVRDDEDFFDAYREGRAVEGVDFD